MMIQGDIESLASELRRRSSRDEGHFRVPQPSRYFIPTNYPKDSADYAWGYLIKFHFGPKRSMQHLTWHALFKGVTVLEWTILFDILDINSRTGFFRLGELCLFGILSESINTRKGLKDYDTKLRGIFKKFRNKRPKEDVKKYIIEEDLLEFMISKLGLPSKGEAKNKFLTTRWTSALSPYANPASRIGVGYKDKGTLGGQGPEPDPSPEIYLRHNNNLNVDSFNHAWITLLDFFE
jgi:hypothetical protein